MGLEAIVIAVIAVIGIGAGVDTFGPNERMPDPLAGYTAVVSDTTGKTLYWTKK